jgi:tripartite-type tricarboxylate transporter receptor subunit TctC
MLQGFLRASPALRSLIPALLSVVVVVAAATAARPDNYPSRPITIIVPFPPGGSSDIVMRLVAQRVAEDTGYTFVIDNRSGAAGNVAALAIKNAPPDGYLLMMGHTGTHAINPALYADLKFDPVKDFQPITALLAFNNILVVPASSPARSVAELVAHAKSRPEGLTYGSQGIGKIGRAHV